MIRPATARPRPCRCGLALIFERPRWPHTTAAIPSIGPPQQKPSRPTRLRTSDQIASGSVGAAATTGVAVTAGTAGVVMGALAGTAPGAAPVTPGTVESGAQPAAPSYHALSDKFRVPAASWRLISSI